MALPITSLPPSGEGYYAINNQFLKNGPKGIMEFKTLENGDTFMRFDLPGVPEGGVCVFPDESKKSVYIYAYAPNENNHESHRSYGLVSKPKIKIGDTKTQHVCECHEISGFTSHMSDGVLRLIISRTHVATRGPCLSLHGVPEDGQDQRGTVHHRFIPGTDPHDQALSGQVLMPHAGVNEGSKMAYESKQLPNGKLYVRVDMPGVPKDNFTVSITNGIVKVTGEAPAVSHDSAGRSYSGVVAMLPDSVDIPSSRIKTIAKDGVIRLLIPSV